jgi:hypothetical protein
MNREDDQGRAPDDATAAPFTFVVGPSHVTRWERLVRIGALPSLPGGMAFIHAPGAPLWDLTLFERAQREAADPASRVLLVVGDFRFGNGIIGSAAAASADPFASGFSHVDHDKISPVNDQLMLERCQAALARWRQAFGARLRIVHWTLAMRAIVDRKAGRHVDADGRYCHPTWSLAALTPPGDPVVPDLGDCLRLPPATFAECILDNDVHPSAIGYALIGHLAAGLPLAAALAAAQAESRARIERAFATIDGTIMVVSEGEVIDRLLCHFGVGDRALLERCGCLFRRQFSVDSLEEATRAGVRTIVVLTVRGPQQKSPELRRLKALADTLSRFPAFRFVLMPLDAIEAALGVNAIKRGALRKRGVGEVKAWLAAEAAGPLPLAVGPEVFADPELATWFQPSYRQQMTLRGVLGLLIGAMRGQSLRPRELALAVDAAIFGVSPRPVRPAA